MRRRGSVDQAASSTAPDSSPSCWNWQASTGLGLARRLWTAAAWFGWLLVAEARSGTLVSFPRTGSGCWRLPGALMIVAELLWLKSIVNVNQKYYKSHPNHFSYIYWQRQPFSITRDSVITNLNTLIINWWSWRIFWLKLTVNVNKKYYKSHQNHINTSNDDGCRFLLLAIP